MNKIDFYSTKFYDKASTEYSEIRYPILTRSYITFLFKRRRDLILSCIGNSIQEKSNLTLLDIGCADGVIIDSILLKFPNIFSRCVGVDISPEMIEMAERKNTHDNVSYCIKNSSEGGLYDIVLAIGFLSPSIFDQEFTYIKNHLKPHAILLCSLASQNSLHSRMKLKDKPYAKDYWTYAEYETYLRKDFDILEGKLYGLFIPKLWSIPFVARFLQPFFESLLSLIFPNLFHEKLYVLKKKA